HDKECRHFLVKCIKTGSNMEFKRKYTKKHKKECLAIKAKCPACFIKIYRNKLKDHIVHCPETEKACPDGCGKYVKNKNWKLHTAKCQYRRTRCADCNKKYRRKDAKKHIKKCPNKMVTCL